MLSDRSSIYSRSSLGSSSSSSSSSLSTSRTSKNNTLSSTRLTPISSGSYKPVSSYHQQPYLTQSMLMAHCIASSGTPTITGYDLASSNIHSNSYRRNYNPSHLSSSSNRYTTASASASSRLDVGQHHHASNALRFSNNSSSGSSTILTNYQSKYNNLPPRGLLSSTRPQPTSSRYPLTTTTTTTLSSSPIHRAKLRERPLLTSIVQTTTTTAIASSYNSDNNNYRTNNMTIKSSSKEDQWSSDLTRNISRNKYIIKFREQEIKQPIEVRKASLSWSLDQASVQERKSVLHNETTPKLVTEEADEAEGEKVAPVLKPVVQASQQEDKTEKVTQTEAVLRKEPKKTNVRNLKIKVKNTRQQTEEVAAESKSKENNPKFSAATIVKSSAKKVPKKVPVVEVESNNNDITTSQLQNVDDDATILNTPEATKRIRFREYSFEDFDFVSVLGHGGWGFVFLAELKNHETYFAVKCIKKLTILEDDDLESIMIERKVLTLGNIHPFICKLFCTFENEAYLFFVMEYCAGGDLMFHVQKEGKFSESRCKFYAAEIICAIRFLHNRHIIYRDLKLDNILLDASGHIRLVDFGMCQCRTYREELLPSNFCGTPEYISPEIIKGVPYNHSVDWWSFGVLLYEMAVGKMPFRGSDENELLWNVCYEQIHYPHFLSGQLKSLLQLLLERDPIKRLGMATCTAGDIYEQPWFEGINWKKIEELKVEPPFVPQVKSAKDVQNFDSDFTDATPQLSPVEETTVKQINQQLFQGFSYTNPNLFFC